MSDLLYLKGIVLESHPYGEADKRLVILTGERGIITAFCKGARRAKSPLAASTECFVYGTFECFAGRDAYTLVRVTVHDYFREITARFEGVALGYYLLELCTYYAVENADERELLNLLYLSIRALIKGVEVHGAEAVTPERELLAIEPSMVRLIFELRAMVIFGEYPYLEEDTRYYDIRERIPLKETGEARRDVVTLSDGLRNMMLYIERARMEKLYSFKVRYSVYEQMRDFLALYVKCHRHHKFKSIELLENSHVLL